MPPIEPRTTRLIILRGNSASGKSSAARRIRENYGHGIAIVGQDVLRRDILHQKDDPGNPAIGLMDLTVRYALDHGYHVILEGILHSASHTQMLTSLVHDHPGRTSCFYWDIPFAETVRRHEFKPQATEYGAELMAEWYRPTDLIPALNEHVFTADVLLEAAVSHIMATAGFLPPQR